MQQKLDVTPDDTFPSVMLLARAGMITHTFHPEALFHAEAPCEIHWFPLTSPEVVGRGATYSQSLYREWYRANGRSTFTALENLLQFRTFFIASPQYAVSPALSSVRFVGIAARRSCASHSHPLQFRMRRSLVRISKSIVSSKPNCTVTKLIALGLFYFRAFLRYITTFVPLPSTITSVVSQVQ